MERVFSFVVCITLCLAASGQSRKNASYEAYIEKYKDIAVEQMLRHKIPASITLAQGLLESGAGKSDLARNGNNHFGIKCHGWEGKKVYHDDDERGECFRAYKNARDSYEDHSLFLTSHQRYASLFRLPVTDYRGWARGLKACGYATNPRYAEQLIGIIELYGLDKYDKATKYDKFLAEHAGTGATEGSPLHPIMTRNKNYYIIARKGDTFRTIGKEIGISYKKIAKYNERDRNDTIEQGETIYLKKKQKRAEKQYKRVPHVVKAGESMYSIAQTYGIRLKDLYKKNHLDGDYVPRVGDKLRVY